MKAIYFKDIIEKVCLRIQGWKARILSFGGRINFIKSVFSSLIPKTVLYRIDKLMANFLWNAQ